MPLLHYGSELHIRLDVPTTRQVMEAAGAHASRGGWVTATDTEGRDWSFLVSAGVVIWIEESSRTAPDRGEIPPSGRTSPR